MNGEHSNAPSPVTTDQRLIVALTAMHAEAMRTARRNGSLDDFYLGKASAFKEAMDAARQYIPEASQVETPAAPFALCYSPCDKHKGMPYFITSTVGYSPPIKTVCPICEPLGASAKALEPLGRCCYGGFKPKSACASCAAWPVRGDVVKATMTRCPHHDAPLECAVCVGYVDGLSEEAFEQRVNRDIAASLAAPEGPDDWAPSEKAPGRIPTNADVDYVLQVYKPEIGDGHRHVYVDSPTVPGLHCGSDTAEKALACAPAQVEQLRRDNEAKS